MSSHKHTGIVLKTYFPYKCKVSLLDRHTGKIMGVPPAQNLCLGALITYTLIPQENCSFLQGVELIEVPFALAHHDLLFFHHVLEICHYFIPIGTSVHTVFDLIYFLYRYGNEWNSYFKKLFLFKLLMTIGFYPEEKQFQTPYFYRLIEISLEKIIEEDNGSDDVEFQLEQWLKSCVVLHPFVNKFNTLHFLDNGRNL